MPSQPIVLRGPRVVLKSLSPVDIPELRQIRAELEVARWWGPPDEESFDAFEHGERLTIEVDGRVAGQIQFEEEPDPEHRYAEIDIYLDPPLHGQGLGNRVAARAGRALSLRGQGPSPADDRSRCREQQGYPLLRARWVPPGGDHATGKSAVPTGPGTTGS